MNAALAIIAGFVYGSGGAAYYILGYGTLAYVLSYYLLPAVWRYRRARGQPDRDGGGERGDARDGSRAVE
jgi:hypothetical protein